MMVNGSPIAGAERAAALARERLLAFRGRLGATIGAAFDRLAARLALFSEAPPGYFLHPLALPILELPLDAAQLARERGAPVPDRDVEAALASAALGYLHVRVEDDLQDEGIGDGPETLQLAGSLLAGHQAALGALVPRGSAFWDLYESTWLGYGEAMALERRLHDGELAWTEARFDEVLRRSAPLVLPPAAVLAAAGLDDRVPALESLCRQLARAHQLHVDLVDVEKDVANGNATWVGARLGAAAGPGALARSLFFEGGLDLVTDEVLRGLDAASESGAGLGLPGVGRWIERRRGLVSSMREEAFRVLFEGLVLPARAGG